MTGRPRTAVLLGVGLVVVGLVAIGLALWSAGGDDGDAPEREDTLAATTAPTTPEGLGAGWAPEREGRSPLRGFGEVAATVTAPDGETCEVCLLLARTPAQRARGLMEVTDESLGGYDGMLFEFSEDAAGGFWMKDTPMPLSIAWFDAAGAFLSSADMAPCVGGGECESYPPGAPYRYALEVLQGGLDEVLVGPGATLRLDGTDCAEPDR